MAWIGLDLGGTKVYGVVVDKGAIRAEAKRRTPTEGGPEAIIDCMAGVVADLGGTKRVKAIGVGAPGLIDRKRGVLRHAPNLVAWLDESPLGPPLSTKAGAVPVVLANDVEAGVLGEHRLGVARGREHVIGIWLGTGVGGGLVVRGEMYRGGHGLAGEIGHTIVHPGGRKCACGGLGHLEAYAGRRSMEQRARDEAAAGRHTMLVDLAGAERMRSGIFARALEAGDPLAVELMDEAIEAVAITVGSFNTFLDLDMIVIGGGMGIRLGAYLAPRIDDQARSLMFVPNHPVQIAPAELGDAAGAAGAALLAAGAH
jgi:glucokinase